MTIMDNMLWARDGADSDMVKRACVRANADEFISQFPDGYNTVVGDRGVRLSGGQVQRIALARAILREPELLILDEATSALDTFSEKLIQQAIEDLAGETTVVIVAHRLSTIRNADYLYVLKEGRIIEEGPYRQLVDKGGLFGEMVKAQGLIKGEI
jgi:ABC-type multidrug transport system fused ATPase/permease subunit